MHNSLNNMLLAVTIVATFSTSATMKEVGKDIGNAARDVANKTVKAIKEN
jgi:hypothetical protein